MTRFSTLCHLSSMRKRKPETISVRILRSDYEAIMKLADGRSVIRALTKIIEYFRSREANL